AGVVQIPIAMEQPPFCLHPLMQRGVGIRGEDVEGGGLDALLDRPFDGPLEDIRPVMIHPENEAAVDHDTEVVEALHSRCVVTPDVLVFTLLLKVGAVDRLESDEQAAKTAGDRFLQNSRLLENRLYSARRLPQPI